MIPMHYDVDYRYRTKIDLNSESSEDQSLTKSATQCCILPPSASESKAFYVTIRSIYILARQMTT